jgi:hypothetical protein
MDIAEMKIANRAKGSAKPNASVAQGNALATLAVQWAWNEAAAEEARGKKLQLFVDSIAKLDEQGHRAFREQMSAELASIRELEKVSGIKDASRNGYSLNSFVVMVSNFRAISEACQLGFKPVDKAGTALTWAQTLDLAREWRSAKGNPGRKTANGKKPGAGRKPLTDYDKAMRLVAKLNLRDLRKVQAAVTGLIEAAETGKRPKVAANEPAKAVA